jgi:signal transduction histidine kinase
VKRSSAVQWLRQHPFAADSLLAFVLTVMSIGAHWGDHHQSNTVGPNALTTLLVCLSSVPLAWRRVNPIAVLAVIAPAQFTLIILGFDGPGWLAMFIAVYSVAAHTSGPARSVATKVFAVVVVASLITGFVVDRLPIGGLISTLVFLVAAFVLGDNLQRRRRASAEVAERAAQAQRERELRARQTQQAERSRIARELHDVVAHSVSLMIIQAGAARRSLATSPDQAESALRDLEATGRSAMDELRRVLGVLRAEDSAAIQELEPQPTLETVRFLVTSDPTLPVELRESGTPPVELPSGVGLSLYRVVQEALTNVRKHAGLVRHVVVHVVYEDDRVEVQITDDGRGASAAANRDGHGLVGMRERMALCGGTVTAGPRPGGGWQVRASAPLAEVYT